MMVRSIIFPLILFIGCYFFLGRAVDCGGKHVTKTITVDKQGRSGAFKNIQAAIDSIKNNNDKWVKVKINPGKYVETINIPTDKPCIILEGSDRTTTLISYGDSKATTTFTSQPTNVILSGITFENTFGPHGPAMAATIYGDKSAIYNCGFLGYQDTLLDGLGRHYFKNCYIQGGADFIYGQAQSFYKDCVINATQVKFAGYITAQRRNSPNEPTGFVFKGGRVDGTGKVILGRPWGPYSRVIFWGTYFSSVVLPKGWDAWHHKGQEKNLFYAEVDCKGPGSNTAGRVSWKKKSNELNMNEYSVQSFINKDGWIAKMPLPIV